MNAAVPVSVAMQSLAKDEAAKMKLLMERGMKIPPQPRILDELQKLMQRREFDVRVLSRTITQDPAITAMLFKVVGNSAYRQHQPFETVEEILHAVGVRQTFNLVQAISLASLGDTKANPQVYEAFWARSQAVGQLAMIIADERVSVCNIFPDQAYLAGMFHDCGVLLLLQRFSSYCKEMRLADQGRWVDLADEDRKYNADHCVVGYIVARHWHLPDFICEAIRSHHDIRSLGMHASRTMVAILQLAIELYYRDHHIDNPEWPRIQDEVLPELGMNADALPEFADIVIERYHASATTGGL